MGTVQSQRRQGRRTLAVAKAGLDDLERSMRSTKGRQEFIAAIWG
jgi:hypothetical protein